MVKVFTTNKDGKIEFTQSELEKLLNEVWNDGYYKRGTYFWSSPTVSPTITKPIITCTNATVESDSTTAFTSGINTQ